MAELSDIMAYMEADAERQGDVSNLSVNDFIDLMRTRSPLIQSAARFGEKSVEIQLWVEIGAIAALRIKMIEEASVTTEEES